MDHEQPLEKRVAALKQERPEMFNHPEIENNEIFLLNLDSEKKRQDR